MVGLLAVSHWAADWSLPADVIKGAIAVSGIYDLKPARLGSRHTYLLLDDAAVERNWALPNLSENMPTMIIAYGSRNSSSFNTKAANSPRRSRYAATTAKSFFR